MRQNVELQGLRTEHIERVRILAAWQLAYGVEKRHEIMAIVSQLLLGRRLELVLRHMRNDHVYFYPPLQADRQLKERVVAIPFVVDARIAQRSQTLSNTTRATRSF
jgi:hypothetical protein